MVFLIDIGGRFGPADRYAPDFRSTRDIGRDIVDMITGDIVRAVQDGRQHLCGCQLACVLDIYSFLREKAFFLGDDPWCRGAVHLGVSLDGVHLFARAGGIKALALQILEASSALNPKPFFRLAQVAANADATCCQYSDHR
ncbi:hypothetical protein D3C81_1628900 [compost metagenome]